MVTLTPGKNPPGGCWISHDERPRGVAMHENFGPKDSAKGFKGKVK